MIHTSDPRSCGVPDCPRQRHNYGEYCDMHYARNRLHGNPGDVLPHKVWRYAAGDACSVSGCGRPPRALSLCGMHYIRYHKTGETGSPESMKNSRGDGYKTPDGYIRYYLPGHVGANKDGSIYGHVRAMSDFLGRRLLDGETVHHKNGIRDDNRIENLELWTANHPKGQRVEDLVAWAKTILERYETLEFPK